ncbi:MAG: site-specific DNA-methyltransferase [Bacilli bacterium]|nr:site-specific DNA-methyltransferase [Bacilli bacterium]
MIALKSLESKYTGKIKCIYIDPPYNTKNAFNTYDDNLEHSIWLSLMKSRLEILRKLLTEDGIFCVQIDNSPNDSTQQSPEFAYLLVLLDEIFGRSNYVASLVWKKKGNPGNTARGIGVITETIAIYAKNKSKMRINRQVFDKKYKFKDGNGDYNLERFLKTDGGQYKRDTMKFGIVNPTNGKEYFPPEGMRWTFGEQTVIKHIENGLIVFLDDYDVPVFKNYRDGLDTKIYNNLLLEHGSLKSAKSELEKLGFNREDFETPKPEVLMKQIIKMFSSKNDFVLDSFLGSGTTAAVAHKMGRKWIGIELGDHAYTHCKTRMDKVIAGERGGVSKTLNWNGGGGYRFYELAPTLIKVDSFGQSIINPEYNADMLAAAVALHEGYDYNPNQDIFWKQAKNGESSYLFTTTRHLDRTFVDSVASQMSENEFLVISCKSFDSLVSNLHKNIAIKKIPQSLLKNCEFDKENYNLNIINPPVYEEEGDDEDE